MEPKVKGKFVTFSKVKILEIVNKNYHKKNVLVTTYTQ